MRRSENAALPKGGKPHPKRVKNQGVVAESHIFKSKVSSVRLKSEQIQLVTVGRVVDCVAIELQGARNLGFLEYRDRQNL